MHKSSLRKTSDGCDFPGESRPAEVSPRLKPPVPIGQVTGEVVHEVAASTRYFIYLLSSAQTAEGVKPIISGVRFLFRVVFVIHCPCFRGFFCSNAWHAPFPFAYTQRNVSGRYKLSSRHRDGKRYTSPHCWRDQETAVFFFSISLTSLLDRV